MVHNQTFTAQQFSYLVRQGDYWKYFKKDDVIVKELKDDLLKKLEENLDISNHQFLPLKSFNLNNKTVFSLQEISKDKSNLELILKDDFLLRKIDQSLKRIYKIKQADRFRIITNVKVLLTQPTPFYVCKLDIKDFYESIDRQKILNDINGSAIVSHETKQLINSFFRNLSGNGLPRGINISATLSEYYMRRFDKIINTDNSFFYYARFVDDIILFSTDKITDEKIQGISNCLHSGLVFNNKKMVYDLSQKKKNQSSGNVKIDYLGYEFDCSLIESGKRCINTRIAPKKLKKIKSRIVASFLSYNKSPNLTLLKDRLIFLSTTYPLKTPKKRMSKYENSGFLHGGILYSYPLIDDLSCLKNLDTFLYGILKSKNFVRITAKLTGEQKNSLLKYSFTQGYKRRISRDFSIDYIKTLVKCWK